MAKRKTNDEFLKEIFSLVGDEYVFMDNYIGSNIKLRIQHKKCGSVYEITPHGFLTGSRCYKCFCDNRGIARRKTNEQFLSEVYSLFKEEYTFLEEYKNIRTKIKVMHNTCNHVFCVTPHNFLRGSSCPKCARLTVATKLKKTQKEWDDEVYSYVGSEYVFTEPYVNDNTKISVIHNRCKNSYTVRPNDFINGYRCPICNESKGETKIRLFLDKKNITYESQYRFDDCRYKNPLPFDFAIMNNEEVILIEYDGEQHFRPIFGEKVYLSTVRNDRIKDKYCKDNEIQLLRIPYLEFDNIEEIIKCKLNLI